MRRLRLMLLSTLLLGCTDQGPSGERFLVVMSGANAQPVPVTTLAGGTASFTLEGTSLSYAVFVTNIVGVTMASLHAGAAGEEGPALVTLYGGPTTGAFSGELAAGTVTPATLTSVSMDSLRTLLRTSHAYLNVRTTSHPNGEIRGQVLPN